MSMTELQKQTNANIQAKANLIWEIATHLVGLFKPHEYGKVILPMTMLKRFDDTLRPEPSFSFFTPLSINSICPSEIAGRPGPKRPS